MNTEIKVVSSTEIRFLDSGSYESLYSSTMRKALGQELCTLFAPVKIESKKVVWYLPNNLKGKFKSIVDAPEEDKGLLYLLWEEKKSQITELLKTKKTQGTLSKILTIPYDSFIYYNENPGAENDVPARRFTLLITGWACEKGAKSDQGQDVAKSDIVQASNVHQNVDVLVVDEKDQPIIQSQFTYLYNGEHKSVSDALGHIAFSLCKVGSQFRLRYDLTGQERSFEVLKNVEKYVLQFSPFVSARLEVTDQHGRQVSNVRLKLSYAAQSWDVLTDGLGVVELPEILYQGDSVMLHAIAIDYGVSKDFQIYSDDYRNGGRVEVYIKDPILVRLRVTTEGSPLSAHSVQIDCGNDTRVMATDANGIIALPYIHEGDTFTVTSQLRPEVKQSYLVNEDQEEYLFDIPAEEKPEIPPVVPPVEEPHPLPYILVLVDGSPTSDYELKVDKAGFSHVMKTDANGQIALEGMKDQEFFMAMSVSDPSQHRTYTFAESQQEYVFEISTPQIEHHYHLQVRINDVPEPGYVIHFDKAGESFDATTNELGIIELPTVKAGDFFLASSVDDPSCKQTYTVTEDVEEYLFLIEKEEPKQKVIKVVDADDQSVPFYEIQVKHNGIVESVVVDAQGVWPMPINWEDGELIEVSDDKTLTNVIFQLVDEQQEYVLKLPTVTPMQQSHVRVIDSKGTPCADYPLSIQIGDKVMQTKTDANGMYDLGELAVGSTFLVADGNDTNVQQQYEIVSGKDEYIFQIQELLNPVVVQLIGKDGQPMPNAQLNLKNQAGAEYSHYTNQEGCIEVPQSYFADKDQVRVRTVLPNTDVKDCKFNYQRQYDHYVIRLKEPFPWGCLWRLLLALLLIALLFVRCERDITVHTLAIDDTPVPGAVVQMDYTEHQLFKNGEFFYNRDSIATMNTDSVGDALFHVNTSVFGWIFYNFAKANVNGKKDNLTGQGDFMYHWLFGKYNLYLMGMGMIRVADATTGAPIANAQVKLSDRDFPGDSLILVTDQQGVCAFNFPAANGGIDRILASASGYSGCMIKDVPYRDIADDGLVILLDPPAQCNSEVNNGNHDQGNHAVKDFFMGKTGGTFQFDFYTDSAPDHIMVYDGSSSDYSNGTAKLILNYFDATNTTTYTPEFSTTLQYTGEYICVVVDEGTNWGYYVHCAQ